MSIFINFADLQEKNMKNNRRRIVPNIMRYCWIIGIVLTLMCILGLGCSPSIPEAHPPADAALSRPKPYDAGPQIYKETERRSIYLTMRDGVKIAVDVNLPKGLAEGDKIPAILWQTRYWRSMEFRKGLRWLADKPRDIEKYFVSRKYAWINVDARGSGASYGHRDMEWSPDEIRDGKEIVDWIIAQPWSNGKVGTTGISYNGTTAEFLVANQHHAVKASAPLFSLFDPYSDIGFPGGIHQSWFTKNWNLFNSTLDRNEIPESVKERIGIIGRIALIGVRPVDEDKDGSLLAGAIQDHQSNYDIYQSALEITFIDDTAKSGFNTLNFSPFQYVDQFNASGAAFYSFSGWFDGGYPHSAIKRFLTLKNPENRLILGPWTHGGGFTASPFNSGKSRFDHSAELMKFFDYYLKGKDSGILKEKRVHYYTMGEEQWKAADAWPPPARMTEYYLGENHTLSVTQPALMEGKDEYQVDFSAGSGNKARWNTLLTAGFAEYPDRTDQDKKLLVYETDAVKEDTEVTGHPVVKLWVSSNKNDGAFFVYLEDVTPTGNVYYVTEGMLRPLHRKISVQKPPYKTVVPYHSFRRQDGLHMEPGQPIELVFDMLPVSYQFKKDHKIRVAISGADKDHFALIPEEPPVIHVHRTQMYPSHIILPVIPKS
jgi:putative CocE/NonD family hydrolase